MFRGGKKEPERPEPRPTVSSPSGSNRNTTQESLVASGMVVTGDCSTPGNLRIDGRVTGNVRARQLVVGPDGEVEGDVSGPGGGPAEGGVVVEGRIAGAIQAPNVEIGRNGSVGSGLDVRQAVVRGRVIGAVVAEERLVLEETAVVEGDVTARRLGVREGGRVSGTIRIGQSEAKSKSAQPGRSGGTGPGTGDSAGKRPDAAVAGSGKAESGGDSDEKADESSGSDPKGG